MSTLPSSSSGREAHYSYMHRGGSRQKEKYAEVDIDFATGTKDRSLSAYSEKYFPHLHFPSFCTVSRSKKCK